MQKKSKNIKKNRSFLFIYLGIVALFVAIGCSGLSTKLDLRFYDFLFKFRKEIPQHEKVVMISIDDESLLKLGEWPWTRNILGDTLIRMKELGAKSASFDIEYLSPSAMGVASDVREKINENIDSNEHNVVELIDQLSYAASSGQYSKNEIPEITEMMKNDYIYPSYDELKEQVVQDIYFDYDEYFARAIQFFGNTYLTINMRDINNNYSEEYIDYINKRFLRTNIFDEKKLIKKYNEFEVKRLDKDKQGFIPAIEVFMTRAKYASFTNSVVDDDGIRRRMEFLYDCGDGFVGQLGVGPCLDNLECEKIIRNKRSITLVNVKFPDLDEPIDLKIPLDEHGYFLINWRHGKMIEDSLENEPVLSFNYLDTCENAIYQCLGNIAANAVRDNMAQEFAFTAYANELYAYYKDILAYKNELLSLCTGYDENGVPYDGITDEMYADYFNYRKQFFLSVKDYIDQGLDTEALAYLDKLAEEGIVSEDIISDYKAALEEDYEGLKNELKNYLETENKIRPKIEDSYCILGNTASSTTDIGAVPFSKQYVNVGIHGNVMNTIMNRKFIYGFDWYWIFIVSAVLSLFPVFISDDKKALKNILGAFIVVGLISLYIVLFVVFSIYFPMITSSVFLVTSYLTGIIYRFIKSDKEKKYITNAFSQCLAPSVVQQLIDNPETFKLGGDTLDMSAIFTDIQKFSSFSELLNAAELVALLNFYLTEMSDIIMEEKGTVDKFEGDAIIALVGAPYPFDDHAYKACSAAIKMKKAEALMNKKVVEVASGEKPEGMDENLYSAFQKMIKGGKSINTRIGINSGEMVAGYMGSENKKNYTMMGNNVNLASRLEGTNKAYASYMMCSAATYERANSGENAGKIIFRALDRVRVVNINTPVQLYNIIGFADEVSEEQKKELDMFKAAYEMYIERNFIEAGKLFIKADKVYHDDTALVMAERCKKYIEEPRSEDWDGVLQLTEK